MALRLILLSSLVCAVFIQGVHSLRCYGCKDSSCPNPATDITEMACSTAQDTCYKFDGFVRSSAGDFPGKTTRTCAATSVMNMFGQGVAANSCVNVTQAKDPYKDEYYTGRICLCNNKDLCNSAPSLVAPGLMCFVTVVAITLAKFAV